MKNNYRRALFSSMIILFNMAAYCLCLLSMKTIYYFASPLTQTAHWAVMTVNSLFFPLLLLFIIYAFRTRIFVLILHFLFLIVLLTSSIYYKCFQSIPHINIINQVYLLRNVVDQIFLQLFGLNEFIISGCVFISAVVSLRLADDIRKNPLNTLNRKKILAFFLMVVMSYFIKGACLNLVRPVNYVYMWDSVRALQLHGFTGVYLNQLTTRLTKEKKLVPWPGKINPGTVEVASREKNNKNIIILQVESIDPQIIDYRVGSKYVMPFLHHLKEKGLYFEHFFAQHRAGASADAELAAMTSLIPLETHSGFRTADYNEIMPLNRVLSGEGYYCAGIHANTGRFFNRAQSYAMMGFDAFFDQEAFRGEAAGWNSKDKAFLEQTLEILYSLPQPFFAYIITMQGHGPFDNYSIPADTFDFTEAHETEIRRYVLTMHEVDQAISAFIAGLEKGGLLKDSVLLLYADSASLVAYPRSYPDIEEDDIWGISPLGCHIPLIILESNVSPGISHKAGSHLDIGPTVLDLVGIDEPEGWLGSSLVQSGEGRVVLNYGRPFVMANEHNVVVRNHETENYIKFIDYSSSLLDP